MLGFDHMGESKKKSSDNFDSEIEDEKEIEEEILNQRKTISTAVKYIHSTMPKEIELPHWKRKR